MHLEKPGVGIWDILRVTRVERIVASSTRSSASAVNSNDMHLWVGCGMEGGGGRGQVRDSGIDQRKQTHEQRECNRQWAGAGPGRMVAAEYLGWLNEARGKRPLN